MLLSLSKDGMRSISEEDKSQVILLIVQWDDHIGPKILNYLPKEENLPFSISQVGQQLFQATVSIYGHEYVTKAEGILLNIENINRNGYVFFDSYPDPTARSSRREYMLGVIAQNINFFNSLKIKEILKEVSIEIKAKNPPDLAVYREMGIDSFKLIDLLFLLVRPVCPKPKGKLILP